jgi:hypothetical protein
VEHEGRQLAERDPAPHDHRDAEEEHGHGSGVIEQLDQGARQQAVLDHLHGAAEESMGRSPEGFALEPFGPECLDQLDAAQDLQEPLVHLGQLLLAPLGTPADPLAEQGDHAEDQGAEPEHHQREFPGNEEQRPHADDDHQRRFHEVAEEQAECRVGPPDVGHDPREHVPALAVLVEAQRQGQQLPTDVHLHVEIDAPEDVRHEVLASEHDERHRDHDDGCDQRDHDDAVRDVLGERCHSCAVVER